MKRIAYSLLLLPLLLCMPVGAASEDSEQQPSAKQRMKELLALTKRSNGVYSVLEAASAGDANVLKERLAEGEDPNLLDERGNSPLHLAVRNKSPRVAVLLLKAGADPMLKDASGRTPKEVCRNKKMREVLNKAENSRHKEIAVDALVRKGDVKAVRSAIKNGVDPNARSADNKGTLVMSAVEAGQPEVLKFLLESGAEADVVSAGGGVGVLHLAAKRGQAEMIHLLLKAGADPMRKAGNGASPLHDAIWHKQLGAVKALLPAYKKVNFCPEGGHLGLPINMAISHAGNDFLNAFIDAGINLKDEKIRKDSPLIVSVRCGRADCMQTLLDAGIDSSLKDRDGKTAADYASPDMASKLR